MKRAITDIFIQRPVMALVVNLLIVVGGVQAIRTLQIRQYPELESSTVTIRTRYTGAEAQLVRGFITTPLERALASADGIDYIESTSAQGQSTIQLRLELGFEAATALADITARVNQVRPDLPAEAEAPQVLVERTDAQVASMYVSFTSDAMEPHELTDYLERVVQPRLSAVSGVQRADLLGGQTLALRVWLDPQRMAALGVAPSAVRRALQTNHYLSAVGETGGSMLQVNLTTTADLSSVEDFRRLVVRQDGDTLVRLEDIAEVVLGADNYESGARESGEPAVFMGVWVQSNANALEVTEAVRAQLAVIETELPTGTRSNVVFDATQYIDSALREVGTTLVETIAIVVIVLFFFLGSFRTVLVPVVAIPLSLLGAVLLMQVAGFSINLLTLLAVVLAVGLVVDDAIVVVENVDRYVREGLRPRDAALRAARELVGPIVAMTITLAAVYAPIGLQGGLTGSLFREFVFTLAGAVLISGVVALTLSPVMSAWSVKRSAQVGWLGQRLDAAFEWGRARYVRLLDWTLDHRKTILVVWGVLTLLVVPLYLMSPTELAPLEDQGSVFGAVDVPPSATIEQIDAHTARVDTLLSEIPEFEASWRLLSPDHSFGGLDLVDWDERDRSATEVLQDVRRAVATVPGIRVTAFQPSALPSAGNFPVEIVLTSHLDHDELLRIAMQVRDAAAASGQVAFPPILDLLIDQQEAEVQLDRGQIASMGLSLEGVSSDLGAMMSGNFVGRFQLDGRSYKIIPQVERRHRLSAEQLGEIHVSGPGGELIPLDTLATFSYTSQPRSLNRFAQLNAVRMTTFPTRSLGETLDEMDRIVAEIAPSSVTVDYAGESRQLRQEQGKFLPAMVLSLVLIFLVLAVQFNSLRDPAVILLGSVPLAMFGALIFTFLKFAGPPGMSFEMTEGWTTTLNIYSQVGLVTLVGLIAKNGILLVEHANVAQEAGASKLEAVREAAKTRLRPILMTTVATVVGHFPLTLVSGPGAAARNSVGIVLVGGMAIGTVFTLLVLPTIYVALASRHRVSASQASEHEEDDVAPEVAQPVGAM